MQNGERRAGNGMWCVRIHHPADLREHDLMIITIACEKRRKKAYRTHETTPTCDECENVRYIWYIIDQKVREQRWKWEVFGVDGKECEIEIPNMRRISQEEKRTIRANSETITQ